MSNERGKNILLGVLIVGLVSMTVAYAALQTQLKIGNNDTQVTVQGGTWGVKFLPGTGASTSGTGVTWTTSPTIPVSGSTVIEDINVSFGINGTGGSTATYNFNITNYGDIDAKISSVSGGDMTCSGTICSSISKTLTYSSAGTETNTNVTVSNQVGASNNEVIAAGDTVGVTLTISIPEITSANLPSSDVTATFSDIVITFEQA